MPPIDLSGILGWMIDRSHNNWPNQTCFNHLFNDSKRESWEAVKAPGDYFQDGI